MKKTALAIMIVTLISKTAGFVREVALSHFYGASAVTDAYFVSQTIPTVIFAFIGAGIGTGFIPMYSRITHTQGAEAANRFTSNLVTTLCVLCTIIVGVSSIFSGPLVRLFASGFTGETLDLATRFTRISVFAIYFTGLSGLVGGYLRIHESYLVPNMVAIPSNLIIIIALVISSTTDIHVLLIGTVVGKASELLFPALFARKKGYRYAVIFDLGDENLRTMIRIAIPVIVGTSMTQINVIVDRALASGIEVGGISALNYANRLTTFVEGLFVMSTASVMYPMISKMASSQRIELLRNAVSESIGLINFMVVPVAVGAVVLAEPIVNLLFGHGAFTADASAMTSTALQFYSLGMLAFGMREIVIRAFYALQETQTPMIYGAVAVAMNIALNIVLSRYLGIGGLALATSISGVVGTALLILALRKKIGGFGIKQLGMSCAKICASSMVMGGISLALYICLGRAVGATESLVLAVLAGAVVYFGVAWVLRAPEAERRHCCKTPDRAEETEAIQ